MLTCSGRRGRLIGSLGYILLDFAGRGPRGKKMATACPGIDSHVLATILNQFQTIFDDLGPDRLSENVWLNVCTSTSHGFMAFAALTLNGSTRQRQRDAEKQVRPSSTLLQAGECSRLTFVGPPGVAECFGKRFGMFRESFRNVCGPFSETFRKKAEIHQIFLSNFFPDVKY